MGNAEIARPGASVPRNRLLRKCAFEKVTPPDPSTPHAVYHAAAFDFRLRAGSKAVDAGVRLDNCEFLTRAETMRAFRRREVRGQQGGTKGTHAC